ncbi:MAG: hypothetical protein QXQ46_09020 [Thermoplasmatales archaeon]
MRKLTRMIYKMLSKRRMWKYNNPGLTEDKLSKLGDEWISKLNHNELSG